MTVEDGKEGVAVAQFELVDAGVLHAFAPACLGEGVPCISPETNSILLPCSWMVCLSLLGSERYTPIRCNLNITITHH